jgi:hypothetical protein
VRRSRALTEGRETLLIVPTAERKRQRDSEVPPAQPGGADGISTRFISLSPDDKRKRPCLHGHNSKRWDNRAAFLLTYLVGTQAPSRVHLIYVRRSLGR